jgi:hypothetical protein
VVLVEVVPVRSVLIKQVELLVVLVVQEYIQILQGVLFNVLAVVEAAAMLLVLVVLVEPVAVVLVTLVKELLLQELLTPEAVAVVEVVEVE